MDIFAEPQLFAAVSLQGCDERLLYTVRSPSPNGLLFEILSPTNFGEIKTD